VDISWKNSRRKREAVPIDRSAEFIPFHLLIAIRTRGFPFSVGISLVSVEQCVQDTVN